MGAKFQLMPTAVASTAAMRAVSWTRSTLKLAASASGTGNTVR